MQNEFSFDATSNIKSQNFKLAIIICVAEFVFFAFTYLSLGGIHFFKYDFEVFDFICCFTDIYILYSLNQYLTNFENNRSTSWINLWITRDIILFSMNALLILLNILSLKSAIIISVERFFDLITLFIFIFSLVIFIQVGVRIRKITNELTGLLNPLSVVIMVALPIWSILDMFGTNQIGMLLVRYLLNMAHVVFIILIFYKASNFQTKKALTNM